MEPIARFGRYSPAFKSSCINHKPEDENNSGSSLPSVLVIAALFGNQAKGNPIRDTGFPSLLKNHWIPAKKDV